jgi:predicted RNase H-like HicB family nuclease
MKFCSAFGETPEKALDEVMKAQKIWLEAAVESGRTIPKAKYRPIIYQIAQ